MSFLDRIRYHRPPKTPQEADALALKQLETRGADLSLPRHVIHFLLFEEEADALTKEHGYVKQYLYELENMPKTGPAFLEKVRKFRADLEEHMDEEEERLFPALRTQLTEEKNALLTKAMNKEGFKVA